MFGNRLVPTTLSVTIEESHFVYSTKPAVCELDRFMHFVKCKAENARVMLVPSPKYTGKLFAVIGKKPTNKKLFFIRE